MGGGARTPCFARVYSIPLDPLSSTRDGKFTSSSGKIFYAATHPNLQPSPLTAMNIHKSVMNKILLVVRQSGVFNEIGYPKNTSVKVMCAVVVDMPRLVTV